ncbi:hypothetical protein WA158_000230 [Blastocystis sp. Blastoise]
MMILMIVHGCSSGDYQVIIRRDYACNPNEIIQLYESNLSNLRSSVSFHDESFKQENIVDYKVYLCGNKDYNLELLSKNSTSWAEESAVTLIYNQIIIVNARLNADDNGKKIIKINLSSILGSRMNWKYSTTVDSVSWRVSKIEGWGEEYKNKEIKNIGTSVYFRKDITVDDSFAVLQLSIQSQSGFIVYVNGIPMYTYLLPEYSKINENTPSQSLEDVPTYKQVVIPKELLAFSVSLTTLKIAIELHTIADHPELLSSFDALTYITNSIYYLDNLSPLSIRCSSSHPLSQTTCNSLLNYKNKQPITIRDDHVSFFISSISPLYINRYTMKFNNNNIPKEWKIYGSNDETNNNWILLDSMNHIQNNTNYEILSNMQLYKYYKVDISSSSSFDIYSIHLFYSLLVSSNNNPRRLQVPTPYQYQFSIFDTIYIDLSQETSTELQNCMFYFPLPPGLTMSSNGILSGTSKEIYPTAVPPYKMIYFSLTVSCDPMVCSHIRVTKQVDYTLSEIAFIKDGNGNLVNRKDKDDAIANGSYDYYGHAGTWSFELVSLRNEMWYIRSYLNVTLINENTNTEQHLAVIRPIRDLSETFYFNTIYSILIQSEWKYNNYDSIPTEWYGSSVDDSTWSIYTSISPITSSNSNQYYIFRKTIPVPKILNQKGFILTYKVLSNFKIYINDHELITYGFEDNYEESSDSSTIIEQSITGTLDLFDNKQDITISILIYVNNIDTIIPFDASLLMAVDNNLLMDINFSVEVKGTNCDESNCPLYMNNYNFQQEFGVYVDKDKPLSIILRSNNVYKYINRYCISQYREYRSPPSSWTVESIDKNGEYHLHSTVTDAFNTPFDPRRQCFSLNDVTEPINTLVFTFIKNNIEQFYPSLYFGKIDFYAFDYTLETIPLLYTMSNPYIAYDNTTISIAFINEEYYHDFTITPSLPDGISIDPNTGSIVGIIHGVDKQLEYTIHAISKFNTPCDYSFSIHIQSCMAPNYFISAHFNFDVENFFLFFIESIHLNKPAYIFLNKNKEKIVDYNLCIQPYIYSFSYTSYNYDSYLMCYVSINNKFFRHIDRYNYFDLRLTNYVDSSRMPIVYSYDNITPPKHWNTLLFNDNLWSTVPSASSLPDVPNDSITQYYRIHYTIEEIPLFINRLDITVSTYAGMIIYINGFEVRRVNMNDGDNIEYNTLAKKEYNEYKSFRSIILLKLDMLRVGDNIIAVEIHKYNKIYQPNSGLLIKINFFIEGEKPNNNDSDDYDQNNFEEEYISNGEESSEYPLRNMYDDNLKTYTIINHKCSDTVITDTYKDETINIVDSLLIDTRNSFSSSYRPISFIVEASNDNWETKKQLVSIQDLDPNGDYNTISLGNSESYESYKCHIIECGIDNTIADNKVVLNELQFKMADSYYCYEYGWTYAYIYNYSYKICPYGYTSSAKFMCSSRYSHTVEGDMACIKINPSELYFKNRNIIMIIGRSYEQYYSIDAIDATINVSPSLPKGIILDTVSQRIYGIPTDFLSNTTFSLSYLNRDNIEEKYEISILITDKDPDTYCKAENNWPETISSNTVTISCPIGYEGSISRYCNEISIWEEPINNCFQCKGTTYYNGISCSECINGVITTINGNNIQCTPCNDNQFLYKNECFPLGVTCPVTTIDSFIYPETRIKMTAVVNCTNENQYGYYRVFCDYISSLATWSDDINKDFCYIRPVVIPGKALEVLECSFELASPIDDVFQVLISVARSFIDTYKYQLTDLLLTTKYSDDNNSDSLQLQVYFGSNMDSYTSSSITTTTSSSKHQSFLKKINSLPDSPLISTTPIISTETTIDQSTIYCQHPYDTNKKIQFNSYYLDIENINSLTYLTTYFCKQDKLEYDLIPVTTSNIPMNQLFGLSIVLTDNKNTYIGPNIHISIYRSLLKSIHVPISQLKIHSIESTTDIHNKLTINYSISFPNEIQIENPSTGTWFDRILLEEQLSKAISFKYSSMNINVINSM